MFKRKKIKEAQKSRLSAFFNEFRPAFRAGDLDLSLSLGDPDLLPAVWADVNVEIFSLGHDVFFTAKPACGFAFYLEKSCIFPAAFRDVFGKHPKHAGRQKQKLQNTDHKRTQKQIQDDQRQNKISHPLAQAVHPVSAVHKTLYTLPEPHEHPRFLKDHRSE